jgi:hypothetical protein
MELRQVTIKLELCSLYSRRKPPIVVPPQNTYPVFKTTQAQRMAELAAKTLLVAISLRQLLP